MVLDPIVRGHSDARHVFGTRTLMKTAQNTEHTSTTSEFVKACKRFRQEFGFSSGLAPDDDLTSPIDSRSKPVPDRSNVILIQVRPCLASFEH